VHVQACVGTTEGSGTAVTAGVDATQKVADAPKPAGSTLDSSAGYATGTQTVGAPNPPSRA
jgi:hypothetical protein